MKEIIGKAKDKIGNKIRTGENEIANEFNKYFVDVGPSLAKNIRNTSIRF